MLRMHIATLQDSRRLANCSEHASLGCESDGSLTRPALMLTASSSLRRELLFPRLSSLRRSSCGGERSRLKLRCGLAGCRLDLIRAISATRPAVHSELALWLLASGAMLTPAALGAGDEFVRLQVAGVTVTPSNAK